MVTSHYASNKIQHAAIKIGTKILPKQLVSDVPIQIIKANNPNDSRMRESDMTKVDVIFVDDEQCLLDGFKIFALGKKVDTYQNPQEFLNKVEQYHRDTKIMLDQNFANYHKKGTEIAEQLSAMGFKRLYLLSGENFSVIKFPSYVKPIMKTDLEALESALNE